MAQKATTIDTEKIDKVMEIFKRMSKEAQNAFAADLEIHMAHLLRNNPEFKKANMDEWGKVKHLAGKVDRLGIAFKELRES